MQRKIEVVMSEAYSTYYISQKLEQAGWVLDEKKSDCNVFQQQSVKSRLSPIALERLERKRPDFTLFIDNRPIAVIEAKKTNVYKLSDAIAQGIDYAERIGEISMVFASSTNAIKTHHLDSGKPLTLNGIEVTSFLTPQILNKFHSENSHKVSTLPKQVLTDRESLINVFSNLNKELRKEGIRAGIERFTEFANFLFLKLLSEHKKDELWDKLVRESNENLIPYLNNMVMPNLIKQYGGQVIEVTRVKNPNTIREILSTLNPLQLTSIDEDVKGVAFEQFLQQTTDTQNDLGEYFTPRHIVRFMVKLLNPKYGETVCDPYCGTGGFLTESFKHIGQECKHSHEVSNKLHNDTLFGGEITTTARIAKMNMILFGDGHSGVIQQDSLDLKIRKKEIKKFNNVLTNIPFSQKITEEVLTTFELKDITSDEAFCESAFNRVKDDGKMAIVVPEGLLFNKKTNRYLLYLLKKSKVHLIVRLPRGVFKPYTDAKTAIIFLTNKGTSFSNNFYIAKVENHGFDSRRKPIEGINDLDKILWWYVENADNFLPTQTDVKVYKISVQTNPKGELNLHADWRVSPNTQVTTLSDIATIENGKSMTEKEAIDGPYPVIAGGAGKVAYYHDKFNRDANVITVSKSGANAGYIWWHNDPIWSSDSLSIRSLDESIYLSRYIYLCLKSKQVEIYDKQQGTGQPHVYKKHLEDFPIPKLSYEKQVSLIRNYQELDKKYNDIKDEFQSKETQLVNRISDIYNEV